MITLQIALSFFGIALGLAIAPGPDIIFVLTQSALYGARAGLSTTLGLMSGLFFHTALVAVGVAAVFQHSPTAFLLLKGAGAAYLLYLAWLSLRSGAVLAQGGPGHVHRLCGALPPRRTHEHHQSQGHAFFSCLFAAVLFP